MCPQEVSRCYGRNGNVSVDPVIVLKMMLLLFWDHVASERELLRIIPLRINYLWFLGYSLVDGTKLHADSSLIRADAAVNSVVRVTLAKLEEPATDPSANSPTNSRGVRTTPVNGRHLVQTDPDRAVARHRSGKEVPSYKNHRLVDDKKGVVTVKRRQWFQERSFAEASTQHGYKRSRWRGLWRQAIQDQIIATLQNLKILLRNLFAVFCGLWRALLWGWENLLTSARDFCRITNAIANSPSASKLPFATA